MYKIDKIDRDIVDLLMEDGRMSCTEMSRHIGLTERSVRYRLNRLFDEGIIKVSAIVNAKRIGYEVVADVWLEVEADAIHQVAEKMKKFDCVSYVAYSIGENDVSVQVIARNNEEVYRFVTEVIGRTQGVRKTTTFIVPFVLKDVYQWRIPATDCLVEKNIST